MNAANMSNQPRSGRRGRPSRDEERAITEAIVQAALRLFLADGYGSTSMKRIGEEAGVAPNTLYARFPDKPALFKAIIEWKTATWKLTTPLRRARPGAPLVEVLETAALGMLEGSEREDISAIGRLLAQEAERFPELGQIYHDVAMSVGRDETIAAIAGAPDAGLSKEAAEEIYVTLTEAVVGHNAMRVFRSSGAVALSRRIVAKRIAKVIGSGWTGLA